MPTFRPTTFSFNRNSRFFPNSWKVAGKSSELVALLTNQLLVSSRQFIKWTTKYRKNIQVRRIFRCFLRIIKRIFLYFTEQLKLLRETLLGASWNVNKPSPKPTKKPSAKDQHLLRHIDLGENNGDRPLFRGKKKHANTICSKTPRTFKYVKSYFFTFPTLSFRKSLNPQGNPTSRPTYLSTTTIPNSLFSVWCGTQAY